jgi:hypothetical protein
MTEKRPGLSLQEIRYLIDDVHSKMFPGRYPERFDTYLYILVMVLALASGTIIARYLICSLILPFILVRIGYEYETWYRVYPDRWELVQDTLRSQGLLLLVGGNAIGYFWHFEFLFGIIGLTIVYIWLEWKRRSG